MRAGWNREIAWEGNVNHAQDSPTGETKRGAIDIDIAADIDTAIAIETGN